MTNGKSHYEILSMQNLCKLCAFLKQKTQKIAVSRGACRGQRYRAFVIDVKI